MLLITGCKGQLGTELSALLPEAMPADIDELDITDFAAVERFVKKNQIDTIVNCAAYTAVDRAEDEVELCEKINVTGPLNLAKSGAKMIHISTDYVFDGQSNKPYIETDKPQPYSAYGKSKLAGEQLVMTHASTAAIIRTSWLYSAHGNNFVKTMLRLGKEKESLNVIFDQIGTPTHARDLARAIVQILPQLKPCQKEIYHFSNEGVCSWYDFAVAVMEIANLKCKVQPIESKDFPTKVVRPFYSVLNKAKIKGDFGLSIPHWRDSLRECLKNM